MTETKQTTNPLSKIDLGIGVFVWLLAFSLYVRTLAPSLLWDDPAEIQTLSYTLGIMHGSGYMTYVMIGNLFTKIPVGNIAYRVNLASAFFGALAVAQVFLIVRTLGNRRSAAITASALLALTQRFWTLAIIAELYAAASALISCIWLLMLLWNRTRKWGYIFAAGLLGGLSVGIHGSIMLTAISVLIYMAISARTKSAWFGAVAGALLGISLTLAAFLYLDNNDPPSSVYNTVYRISLNTINSTPDGFNTPLERLRTIFPVGSFIVYYFTAPMEVIHARLAEYISLFPLWAVILIAIGILAIFFRPPWYDGLYPLVGFLLIWGLGVTVSLSSYRDFYVPAAVFTAVWFGAGANSFLSGVDRFTKQTLNQMESVRATIMASATLILVLLPFLNSRTNIIMAVEKGYTDFIRHEHVYPIYAPDKAIQDARKILIHVDTNAIVFSNWDKLYSMVYTAQLVANRKDVDFHEAYIFEDQQRLTDAHIKFINANIDTRPIYFMMKLDNFTDFYRVEQVGDSLYRLYRK